MLTTLEVLTYVWKVLDAQKAVPWRAWPVEPPWTQPQKLAAQLQPVNAHAPRPSGR